MSRLLHIGLSAVSGIGLGILLSYALSKEKDSGNAAILSDKKSEKPSGGQGAFSYNTSIKRKKRYPEPGKHGNIPVKAPDNDFAKRYMSRRRWERVLKEKFERLQVCIINTSVQERTITLWGANKSGYSVSSPNPDDVEDHSISAAVTIPAAMGESIQPQGIAVNPVNGYGYAANQLSNNVSVIPPDGGVVALIQLQPSNLPGSNSPVAVAVNTASASPHYGRVYVAGSVADTISVIDLAYTVTNEIAAGPRPVDVAFNPVNENLYVANLAGDSVTVIDTTTETVSATLSVGSGPLAVGINPVNGDIYVANSGDNSVTVFDQGDNLITTIAGVGNRPISITYNPANDLMYVVGNDSNQVIPIDPALYTTLPPIGVGNSPGEIVFNTNNDFLYVGNAGDDTYTVIAPDNTIRATLSLGNVSFGLAINQAENVLFASDTQNNTVNVIGYNDQSSSIIINDDYHEQVKNMQHIPARVEHVKFALSGEDRFEVLTLREETITGKFIDIPFALSNYNHPQNFLNAYDAFGLEGQIISGYHSWILQIAGEQTISIMVYFKRLDTQNLLAEHLFSNLKTIHHEKDRLPYHPKHRNRRRQRPDQRRYYHPAHRSHP